MTNNEVIKDEKAAGKRESLSKRIERCNDLGHIMTRFVTRPLKGILIGKDRKFEKDFANIVSSYLNIQETDFDGMTFGEFLVIFDYYLYCIKNDPDYGISEEACPYLPVFTLMRFIKGSIWVNMAAKIFLSINFDKFRNYIAGKPIGIEINNLWKPGCSHDPKDTIGDILNYSLDACMRYWTPGDDIRTYMSKMTSAYDDLYHSIYCPIISALFMQTGICPEEILMRYL